MPTSAHLFLTVNARDQTGVVFPTANNDNEHLFVEQQMPELTLYQAYTLCSPNLYDNSARWWVGRDFCFCFKIVFMCRLSWPGTFLCNPGYLRSSCLSNADITGISVIEA